MAETVFTQGMIDALKRSYASGTLRLTYEGKTIEYRSLTEMERAINKMQSEVNRSQGVQKSRQVRMKTRRGL